MPTLDQKIVALEELVFREWIEEALTEVEDRELFGLPPRSRLE